MVLPSAMPVQFFHVRRCCSAAKVFLNDVDGVEGVSISMRAGCLAGIGFYRMDQCVDTAGCHGPRRQLQQRLWVYQRHLWCNFQIENVEFLMSLGICDDCIKSHL